MQQTTKFGVSYFLRDYSSVKFGKTTIVYCFELIQYMYSNWWAYVVCFKLIVLLLGYFDRGVAHLVRAFASHSEGWVFESHPRTEMLRKLEVTVQLPNARHLLLVPRVLRGSLNKLMFLLQQV